MFKHSLELRQITLKEAVKELNANRTVFYTYRSNHGKSRALWELTDDSIKHVLIQAIEEEDEVYCFVQDSGFKLKTSAIDDYTPEDLLSESIKRLKYDLLIALTANKKLADLTEGFHVNSFVCNEADEYRVYGWDDNENCEFDMLYTPNKQFGKINWANNKEFTIS